MNNFIKKYKNKINYIYLFFICVISLYHIVLRCDFGDDVTVKLDIFTGKYGFYESIFRRLKTMMHGWSTRTIIEFVLYHFIYFSPIVWKIVDVFLWVLLLYSFDRIIDIKDDKVKRNLLVFLLLQFPYIYLSNAGWIATGINYLWVISFGAFSCTVIRKVNDYNKINKLYYIFALLACAYAANQEQMCVFLTTIFFVVTIYFIIYRIKWWKLLPFDIVCLAELLYVLLMPGEKNRVVIETSTWFPDFKSYDLIDKILLGITRFINKFFFEFNAINFIFLLTVIFIIWQKYNGKIIRIMSVIPMMVYLLSNILRNVYPQLSQYLQQCRLLSCATYSDINTYIAWGIYVFTLICLVELCILMFYSVADWIVLVILGLGCATVIAMGFSPTVYASSDRIFCFMYFAILLSDMLLLKNKNINSDKMLKLKKYDGILLILSVITIINTIMEIIDL